MKIIILDAGSGNRLLPWTQHTPKCLLDAGDGRSILEHQLSSIARCAVDEVVIVGGYQIDQLRAAVADYGFSEFTIKILHNPQYNLYNNLYSLWIARSEMDGDLIVMNGDDVFDYRVLERLVQKQHDRIVLTIDRKNTYDQDDMKVQIRDGYITAVTKIMRSEDADAESIGMMKFQNGGVALLREQLQRLVNSESGVHHFWLKAIQQMIDEGEKVGYIEIGDLPWQEVDFPNDLEKLRRTIHLYPHVERPLCRVGPDDTTSDHYSR